MYLIMHFHKDLFTVPHFKMPGGIQNMVGGIEPMQVSKAALIFVHYKHWKKNFKIEEEWGRLNYT
jgi:hypothetical protein